MTGVKKSILEACHGAILEVADNELERILANINDINTDPKKKRKMNIELVFEASKDREQIHMSAQVKSKIEPLAPTETTLFNVVEENKETGEVVNVLKEMTGQAPGQINFDGDIVEPEVFVIGMEAEKIIAKEQVAKTAEGERL